MGFSCLELWQPPFHCFLAGDPSYMMVRTYLKSTTVCNFMDISVPMRYKMRKDIWETYYPLGLYEMFAINSWETFIWINCRRYGQDWSLVQQPLRCTRTKTIPLIFIWFTSIFYLPHLSSMFSMESPIKQSHLNKNNSCTMYNEMCSYKPPYQTSTGLSRSKHCFFFGTHYDSQILTMYADTPMPSAIPVQQQKS